jgi:hypothetical protein
VQRRFAVFAFGSLSARATRREAFALGSRYLPAAVEMERGGLGWTEIQTQADDNLSRFSSYSNATIAEASTTLSVTVFADEPRRFVPSREIEARDPGDDFVNPQPTWRRRSLVDQRPQFALQRPMVSFGALAQPPDLVFRHAFDREIQD